MNSIDIKVTLHPKATEYTLFSSHGKYFRLDYSLGHKTSFSKLWRLKFYQGSSETTLYETGSSCPLQYSCLENSTHRGVWWAAVHMVIKVDTTERHTSGQKSIIRVNRKNYKNIEIKKPATEQPMDHQRNQRRIKTT